MPLHRIYDYNVVCECCEKKQRITSDDNDVYATEVSNYTNGKFLCIQYDGRFDRNAILCKRCFKNKFWPMSGTDITFEYLESNCRPRATFNTKYPHLWFLTYKYDMHSVHISFYLNPKTLTLVYLDPYVSYGYRDICKVDSIEDMYVKIDEFINNRNEEIKEEIKKRYNL